MGFVIGQRVRTTEDAPSGWEGAFSAPAGTLGTITGLPTGEFCNGYGVLLDGDPDQLPAHYAADELADAS
jgi:hypothetical protein